MRTNEAREHSWQKRSRSSVAVGCSTVQFEVSHRAATITLNRPDRLNVFSQERCDEFADLWERVRADDEIHVRGLRASGDRAFCTGVDVKKGIEKPDSFWVGTIQERVSVPRPTRSGIRSTVQRTRRSSTLTSATG